ncbi:MAG: DUF4595 domain-containing protein [Alistipes sp.]|nr:DUF4595 domain-containing protein [Alistipes sp.]
MKRLSILLSMFAVAVMTGCDSPAEEENGGAGSGGNSAITDAVHPVYRMDVTHNEGSDISYKFRYDDSGKHIVSLESAIDEYDYTSVTRLVRDGNKATIILWDSIDETEEEAGTITFDSDGYLSELIYYEVDDEDEMSEYRVTFTYNDGYLVKVEESGKYKSPVILEWKDGNLASVTYSYSDSGEVETRSFSYSYGDKPLVPITVNLSDPAEAVTAGDVLSALTEIFGKQSKYLPESCTVRHNDETSYVETYKYTLNADGTVAARSEDDCTMKFYYSE